MCVRKMWIVAAIAAALSFAACSPGAAQAPAAPAKPDVAQPDAAKPEAPKSETPKSETPKSEASKAAAVDPFGEELTLAAKPMVFFKGTATWDTAFETLTQAFKNVNDVMQKQGIKAAGPAMTVYIATDDTGFTFQAGYPIAEEPKDPPKGDIAVGKSPEGKALKFVHRGSYDSMESTYDAVTNFIEEKQLEARDQLIEQYLTDPLSTPEEKLVIEVLVLIK
jgi:effector-binding domain-containing protein